MKRLLAVFILIISGLGAVYSQIPPPSSVVSKKTFFPNLKGDQVITRVYNGDYTITHFRHKEDAYVHSFLIQNRIPFITKRIQVNINSSFHTDTLYRLAVNDMRIEGDNCYFCGNVTRVGPSMLTPQGNIIWPERDPVGFVGYFSITELLAGHVYLKFQLFYDVYDLTRMAIVPRSSGRLMVAAIGTLTDEVTPCVLELNKLTTGSWTESLGSLNSEDEVFSDILYNANQLIIASYRRCNGDEGGYENEPNHWKFTLHNASNSGFCLDYVSGNNETAAEYDTYGLTSGHDYGWHYSDVSMRLCKLAAGRTCMAYGTINPLGLPSVILFSLSWDLFSADTILRFSNDMDNPSVVREDKNALYPTSPSISCDVIGLVNGGIIGSTIGEKGEYIWDVADKNINWHVLICDASTVDYEIICTE